MAEKQFFSVIRKNKTGAVLRNPDTRVEQEYTWEQISTFFIEENKWLYSWNNDNPQNDEIEKLRKDFQSDMSDLMFLYLLSRKKDDVMSKAVFGNQISEMSEKYALSVKDIILSFRAMHNQMFGCNPNADGILEFQG